MRTVRLEISPTPAHVRTARLVAVAVARQCGVAEGLLDEIRLAVGEACSRAVGLHRIHAPTALVAIEFFDGPRFGVAVRDCAPAELALADDAPDPFALLHASAPTPMPGGGDEAAENPAGQQSSASEPFAEEAIAAGVGLALLAGLVDDLQVGPAADGTGTVVRMSWPIG
jgi:anti-sigma regulatory factor (Ser/Thr protein kinase)